MNNLIVGSTVKVSYTTPEGTVKTGIGYIIDESKLSIAWSHGDVGIIDVNLRAGFLIEAIIVSTIKEPADPVWKLQDYINVPQKREAFERLDDNSWDVMTKYLFGGHLEPGDIISNSDYSEVYCISSIEYGIVKGYKLLKRGKWSTRVSLIFGLSIGYHKMIKEKQ